MRRYHLGGSHHLAGGQHQVLNPLNPLNPFNHEDLKVGGSVLHEGRVDKGSGIRE